MGHRQMPENRKCLLCPIRPAAGSSRVRWDKHDPLLAKNMETGARFRPTVIYQKARITSTPAKRAQFTRQSVRAVPVRIISVSKKRSQGVHLLVEEYKQKILQYCSVEDVQVKANPKSTSNVSAQIEGEDAIMMQHIKPEDWVVMLDENGVDIGSKQMADLVESAGRKGSTRMSFCIGGPHGHGPQVRKRADVVIRLSSMVLNHQIALIVLLEQIYRAWTILKGQKYHH